MNVKRISVTFDLSFVIVVMESVFDEAVKYALDKVGRSGICLRDEQVRAMKHVYDGFDTFVWLYQQDLASPCVMSVSHFFKFGRTGSNSLVIVISPLRSLMVDQVSSLRKRGVSSAILNGHEGIDPSLLASENDFSKHGKYSLVFAAPEAIIGSEKWRKIMLTAPLMQNVVAMAVDEVHCVSKW